MQGTDLEAAGVRAVAVVGELEVRRSGGCALLGVEPPTLGLVGSRRVEDVEEMPAQVPQGGGVVLPREVQEVLLRAGPVLGVDGLRQGVDRPDHHAGLVHAVIVSCNRFRNVAFQGHGAA